MKWLLGLPKIIFKSKAYLAGAAAILSGASMILVDAVKIDSLASAMAFAASLPEHPGTIVFLNGLGIVGLRHAVAKGANGDAAPAPGEEPKNP